MTDPTKVEGEDTANTVWQADIRSPSPTSSVEDQDGNDVTEGEDEVNSNGKRGKKDRLWFELDLSSREDHAKVEHNPFTIARKNKRAKQEQVSVKTIITKNQQGNDADKAPRITVTTKDRGNDRDRQAVPETTSSASKDRAVIGSGNTMPPDLSPRKLVHSKPTFHAKSADSHDRPHALSKTSTTSKQDPQPNQIKKTSAINTKIAEGHSPNFPILQGLRRQKQIAQEQQKQQERAEQVVQERQQLRRERNAWTEMTSGAQAIDVTPMQQAKPRAHPPRFSAAGALVANDDFVSEGRVHGQAIQFESPQIDIQYAFYPESAQTHVSTTYDRREADGGVLSLASRTSDPFLRPYHHQDGTVGEGTFIPQEDQLAGLTTRLPPSQGSLLYEENPSGIREALPSRNTRLSLPSTRLSQGTAHSSHSRELYSRMHRESSASLGRDGNASKFFAPQARTNQAVSRPSYSEGRGGANTRTQIHRASRTNDIETSPLQNSASGDSEWSTLPGKKASYTLKGTGVNTKAFRLPGKLFGTPSGAIKADPGEPSQRSTDSATEVVLPLRRKLTLFQPSPPKPGDGASS